MVENFPTYRDGFWRRNVSTDAQRVLLLAGRSRRPEQLRLPLAELLHQIGEIAVARQLGPRCRRLLPRRRSGLRIRLHFRIGETYLRITVASRRFIIDELLCLAAIIRIRIQQALAAAEEGPQARFRRARYRHGVLFPTRVFVATQRFEFLKESLDVARIREVGAAAAFAVRHSEPSQQRHETLFQVVPGVRHFRPDRFAVRQIRHFLLAGTDLVVVVAEVVISVPACAPGRRASSSAAGRSAGRRGPSLCPCPRSRGASRAPCPSAAAKT
jgi:hypothetical protein